MIGHTVFNKSTESVPVAEILLHAVRLDVDLD